MGDSWDETSLEVSEAVSRTDDLDADLFGSLSPKKGPSLLQAMKNKTGKGIFDEQEVKPKPAAGVVRNTPAPAAKQPAVKTPKSPDDDLLADLLSDSDYSEISNRKPPTKAPPSKTPAAVSTLPAKFNPVSTPPVGRARGGGGGGGGTTPNRGGNGGGGGTPNRNPGGGKPQDKGLFDDDDDLSGMLDSEPIAPPSRTGSRNNKPAAGNNKPAPAAGKPASAPGNNKFSDLLSRTSLMKEEEDHVRASTAPGRRTMDQAPSTPQRGQQQTAPSTPQRGTGPRGGSGGGILDDSIGFTPRPGVSSAARSVASDDIFGGALEKPRTPQKRPSVQDDDDIFRVDNNKPSPALADMFR
eukprot:sb/3466153/